MKPKGFVGSSVESLPIARAIQAELDRDAEIEVWDQGIFEPSESTLESLLEFLDYFQFAIFVLSPDDLVKIRTEEHRIVRDNVIFELGLFFGGLGKERTFMVVPRNEPRLKLPTDLVGLTLLDFDASKSNLRAALGPACTAIRLALGNLQAPVGSPTFHILASSTDLTQYGLTELLGEIRIVKGSIPANAVQRTMEGDIAITYSGIQISNCFLGEKLIDVNSGSILDDAGIKVTFDRDYLQAKNTQALKASVHNTPFGGRLIIHIPEGIVLRQDGSSIVISGVRGDCSGKSIGATVLAQASAYPIKAASFLSTNPVTIAQVHSSMRVQVTAATVFVGEPANHPTIQITEGFAEAFVHNVHQAGANGNTQIRVQLGGSAAGINLIWPDSVESQKGISRLALMAASNSAAVYEFRTDDQGKSDLTIETFDVVPRLSLSETATSSDLFVQVQLWPDGTSTSVPRFNHPLLNVPADLLVRVKTKRES